MRQLLAVLLVVGLTACSGSGSNAPVGKADMAAAACDAFVKNKLDGKQYKLDLAPLAASLKESAGAEGDLTASIIIEPGLTTEVKQNIQCNVRFGADGKPEVLNVTFIW